jgi:hypothetical protein
MEISGHKKTRLPIGKRVRTHYENTLKTYQEFKFVAVCFVFLNHLPNKYSIH